MKKHGYSRKLVIVLLTSVSAAATLSACSSAKSLIDGWTNDREGQVVAGGKRVPALNPQYMPAPQTVAPSANPVVYDRKQAEAKPAAKPEMKQEMAAGEAPKRVPTFEESPIDYFDNEGNAVEPKQPEVAAKQAANDDASEENFFTRLFRGNSEDAEVQKLRTAPRKPLLDNQYAPAQHLMPMTDVAPIQPEAIPLAEPVRPIEMKPEPAPYALSEKQAPVVAQPSFTPAPLVQSDTRVDTQKFPEEPLFVESKPVEAAADAGTVPPVEVNESREKPNWFERTFGRIENQFKSDEPAEEMQKDSADSAAEDMEYPALASVPQAPEQFAVVKADKDQKMEDMQAEHMQAEQNKFDLFSEPSGIDATVPVEIVQPLQEPKISKPLVAEPVLSKQAEVITPEAEKVELLGHVSAAPAAKPNDVPVKMESVVNAETKEEVQTIAAPQMPQADVMPETPKAMTSEEQPQQNRWWEGWRIFSAESKQPEVKAEADVAVEAPVVSETAPQQLPVPIVQMPVQEQVAEEKPVIQPMIATPVSEPAKPLAQMPDDTVKPAPQVVEAEEAAPVEEAKPAAGALPSPQILREVKMLPPSRYSARARTSDAQAQ